MITLSKANKNRIYNFFLVLFVSLLVGILIILTVFPYTVDKYIGLPIINISLNEVSLNEIHDGAKTIKYPNNSLTLTVNNQVIPFDDVELKGRGNYTWSEPKRPYQIKLDANYDFLGMGKGKKWLLLTNNLDDSHLRNWLAFSINDAIDSNYPLNGEFVELTIDNNKLGLYYVTNKIDINKNSIDLRDPRGILVELDNTYCFDEDVQYRVSSGDCLALKRGVSDDLAKESFDAFVNDFNEIELAAKKGDYETVKQLFDVDSMAEYYLISEITANPDAYVTSFYFYKDGDDDLIHVGPGWDFDGAFGNLKWEEGRREAEFYSPETLMARRKYAFGGKEYDAISDKYVKITPSTYISRLVYYLIDIPEFYELVCEKYKATVEGKSDLFVEKIDEEATYIRESAIKDNNMWEKNDFDRAVLYLKDWIKRRVDYLDSVFGNKIRIDRIICYS